MSSPPNARPAHPASPDLTLPDSVEEAFTLLQETLGFDRLAARQDVDGTIRPDEIETFSATKTLIESLPEVRIEGACDGPPEYKLGQTLGEGGMGVVRIADQVSLHRSVAVKTLRPEKSSDAALLALLREAWVTGALEHPNIVPVYALGRNEEKMPVFVMKRVEGTPWSTLLAEPSHPLVARGSGDKDPLHFHLEARFASISEMKRALEAYQEHRASSRLTREAQERLAQLEALVAAGEEERQSVEFYRLFGECHFGFQQALGSWAENGEAAEGKTRAVRLMVEFELERENADAAAAWLTELPPDAALEERLAALRRGLSEKSAEIDKLRRLEAEVDLDVGKSGRSLGALTEAIFWLVANITFGYLAREDLYVFGTLDYFYLTMLGAAVSPAVVWWRRDVLLSNAVNRSIMVSLWILFMASGLFWLVASVVGMPFASAVPLVLLLLAAGALVLAAFVEKKLIYSGASYLLAAVAAVAYPQFSYELLGLGSFVGFGVVAYMWSPIEVCPITGRVLLSHLGEVSRRHHV